MRAEPCSDCKSGWRASRLSWALPYLAPRGGLSAPMVVGKQGEECNVCGQQGAASCSLLTDTVIFITLEGFFPPTGISVTKLFGSGVRVHECCMSPVSPVIFSKKSVWVPRLR